MNRDGLRSGRCTFRSAHRNGTASRLGLAVAGSTVPARPGYSVTPKFSMCRLSVGVMPEPVTFLPALFGLNCFIPDRSRWACAKLSCRQKSALEGARTIRSRERAPPQRCRLLCGVAAPP